MIKILATILFVLIFTFFGYFFGLMKGRRETNVALKKSRAVLGGKIAEKLAPYLPGFPEGLKPSEARFMGDPIDFVVFKGLDDKKITEVVFVEVKTGKSQLNPNELSLRDVIIDKKVRWEPYHVADAMIKEETR